MKANPMPELDLTIFEGHTPGDWREANGGIWIAETKGPDCEANARLIAAAPALLAEVKRLREALSAAKDGGVDIMFTIAQREGGLAVLALNPKDQAEGAKIHQAFEAKSMTTTPTTPLAALSAAFLQPDTLERRRGGPEAILAALNTLGWTVARVGEASEAQVEALNIAINLMERHLAMVTPGGVGQDSNAYRVARSRITTLQAMRPLATLAEGHP